MCVLRPNFFLSWKTEYTFLNTLCADNKRSVSLINSLPPWGLERKILTRGYKDSGQLYWGSMLPWAGTQTRDNFLWLRLVSSPFYDPLSIHVMWWWWQQRWKGGLQTQIWCRDAYLCVNYFDRGCFDVFQCYAINPDTETDARPSVDVSAWAEAVAGAGWLNSRILKIYFSGISIFIVWLDLVFKSQLMSVEWTQVSFRYCLGFPVFCVSCLKGLF